MNTSNAFKGLWTLLAVALFSSVAFGNAPIPATYAPQQAVVDTVLLVIDGVPAAVPSRAAASAMPHGKPVVGTTSRNDSLAASESEATRLAEYIALHKGQFVPR